MGKQKIPAVANFVGYYCIGLPLAVTFMFVAKLRVLGTHTPDVNTFVILFYILKVVVLTHCPLLNRFLARHFNLRLFPMHRLHHSHLQTELGENNRGGMLTAN